MKKIALALTISMISVILPFDFPIYSLSSQALANESNKAIPTDPLNKLATPAIPAAAAIASQKTAQNVVANKNATPSTGAVSSISPATPISFGSVTPVITRTYLTSAAAIKAAQAAMEAPVNTFVNANWTGLTGLIARPIAKAKVKEKLNELIGLVINSGGAIGFSNERNATKNLVVTMTYPGGIILTLNLSKAPGKNEVVTRFASNINTEAALKRLGMIFYLLRMFVF